MAKYILITEDQEIFVSDEITDDEREAEEEGILTIVNISDPSEPTEILHGKTMPIPKWEF